MSNHGHTHRSPPSQTRTASTGFTLIEVLVVMVVIGIMAAIVSIKVLNQPDWVRHEAARTNIKTLSSALALYQLQHGALPTTEQGLEALVNPTRANTGDFPSGGYIDRDALVDPWGRDYVYLSPGEHGPFDLISLGRDGVPGGDGVNSDLTSW